MRKLNRDKLVVVTGGAGFIGSCFIRYLNDKGFTNAVVVDNFHAWKNLRGKAFAEIVPIDELFDWLEGREDDIQAIVHLGAESSTVENDPDFLLENNYRYSLDLAEYALRHELRFIYASSAATYGREGFSDSHDQIDTLEPLNMYGFSKHAFDQWVLRHELLDEFVGLKYFNVFGPNEGHKGRMASMVPQMVQQIQESKAVRLFKSGEQKRDFIYVKDAVAMTYSFLENDLAGIYNVGTGIATSWNELASAVFKALDLPVKIEYIDIPEDLTSQYQDYTCADMGKWKNLKTTSIDEAVADYIQNYILPAKLW